MITVVILSSTVFAQQKMGYKMLVPNNDFRGFGYVVRIGNSMMSPMGFGLLEDHQVHRTTTYEVRMDPIGGQLPSIGLGLNFAAERGVMRYYSIQVDYIRLQAGESLLAERNPGSDQAFPETITAEGSHRQGRLSLRFSPQVMAPVGQASFLRFGMGMNIQTKLHSKEQYEIPFLDVERSSPLRMDRVQLDADIAWAFLVAKGRFIDIGYRRPWLALDRTRSTLETIFNSEFRLHYITIGYNWMSKRPDRMCIDHASPHRGGARLPGYKRSRISPW